jgi:hypothetical protein
MSFLTDTFSDTSGTLASAHTSDSGAPATVVAGDTSAQMQGGYLQAWGADSFIVFGVSPAGTDYTVSASIYRGGSPYYGLLGGVIARGSLSSATGYVFGWDPAAALWKLQRHVGGVVTSLGTDASNAVAFSTPTAISLKVAGAGADVTLTAKVGATTLFSGAVTDSSGSRIVAANQPGAFVSTNNSGAGVWLDSLAADDDAATGGDAIIDCQEARNTLAAAGDTIATGTIALTPLAPTFAALGSNVITGSFGEDVYVYGFVDMSEAKNTFAAVGGSLIGTIALSPPANTLAMAGIAIPTGGILWAQAAATLLIAAERGGSITLDEAENTLQAGGTATGGWQVDAPVAEAWTVIPPATDGWTRV